MGLTQVSTKGIKDGTILNEDISNSAAIDASKISGLATDKINEGNTSVEVIDAQGNNDIGVIKADLGITSNAGQSITESNYFHSTKSGNDYTTEINQAHNGNNNTFKLSVGNTGGTGQFRIEKGSSGGDNAGVLQYATGSSGAGGQWTLSTGGQSNYRTTQTTNIFTKDVVPDTDSQIDLGSNTVRWQNVYADDYYGSGANLTNLPAAQLTGALPAIDGSNLTGISAGTSLSGSTNDTICTVTGANAIQGEANLTFTSDVLQVSSTTQGLGLRLTNTANEYTNIQFSAARTGADQALGIINAKWNNNHEVAAIYLTAGDDTSNKDDGKIKFYTSAASGSLASRLEILNDGDVKVSDGDLVIGTSGHGIDFSATADGSGSSQAELFDDYEEGTWTPTVSSGNASFSTVEGRYVKVGRLVTLWFRISGGGSYSGSGALKIGGLPFSNNTGVGVTGTSEYYKINFAESYSDHVTPYVTGSNIQWLRNNSGSGSGNYLTISQLYSGAAIKTFICYGTDS